MANHPALAEYLRSDAFLKLSQRGIHGCVVFSIAHMLLTGVAYALFGMGGAVAFLLPGTFFTLLLLQGLTKVFPALGPHEPKNATERVAQSLSELAEKPELVNERVFGPAADLLDGAAIHRGRVLRACAALAPDLAKRVRSAADEGMGQALAAAEPFIGPGYGNGPWAALETPALIEQIRIVRSIPESVPDSIPPNVPLPLRPLYGSVTLLKRLAEACELPLASSTLEPKTRALEEVLSHLAAHRQASQELRENASAE